MRRRLPAFVALLALALPLRGATAGDPVAEPRAGARGEDDPLECRIFRVGAITHERTYFDPRDFDGSFPTTRELRGEEDYPLYSGPGEEGIRPFGSDDDLIELVKAFDPIGFSREGTSIASAGVGLAVRAPRSTQARVARTLAELERAALRTVTVDVLVVRGDARAADDGGFLAALGRGDLVVLAGARGVSTVGGRTTVRAGTEAAYLADEDVEVAQEAYLSDPIVRIVKGGLFGVVNVNGVFGDRVPVEFDGWWAEPSAFERVVFPKDGAPVERSAAAATRLHGHFDLPLGRWTLVEAAGDVAFAFRPSARAHDAEIPEAPVLQGSPLSTIGGDLVWRTIDVRDLGAKILSRRGPDRRLSVSRYTPPEPPELAEPAPRFPVESLVETIRTLDPILAECDDIVLELRGGFLDVHAPLAHVEAIERFVERLRRLLVPAVRVRATVVSLPLASIPEYLAGLDDGAALVADGGVSLLARAGAAVVDRASVRISAGERAASSGGRAHGYVADYDVEIAQGARIGNPIVREVPEGFGLDVAAGPALEPGTVFAEVRLDRAQWLGSRTVPTPNGDLEGPTIAITRLRGGTPLRPGAPRIVGATLERGVVTLTILGSSVE